MLNPASPHMYNLYYKQLDSEFPDRIAESNVRVLKNIPKLLIINFFEILKESRIPICPRMKPKKVLHI